jgi:hypothetical protein
VEIDDGPASTLAAAALLANYHYTAAPPGVSGGAPRPFVGTAAHFVKRIGGNGSYLSFADLRALQAGGWGVCNHSYAHSGSGLSPLTPEQIREDHFWSQTILATEVGRGRAPSHFVYANGWSGYAGPTADDFSYFDEFGFRSATSTGGTSPRNLFSPTVAPRKFRRANLDGLAAAAPLRDFTAPGPNELVIDFTHSVNATPGSDNRQAWAARLSYLESTYGAAGADDVWSAPSAEIFDYVAAAKGAAVSSRRGRLHLELPEGAPGAALTLRLEGIAAATVIAAPPAGAIYRAGTTVWLTTPFLGQPGAPTPFPRVVRVYQGPVQPVAFSTAVRVAGVQIHQQGTAPDPLAIDLTTDAGTQSFFLATGLGSNWGDRKLFSRIPAFNGPSLPFASGLQVTANTALREMTVWALDESVRHWAAWQEEVAFAPGAAGELADPDKDGLCNLLEYALGSDPLRLEATAVPTVACIDGYLEFTFSRTSAHPDVVIAVEASTDLADPTAWSLIAQSASGAETVSNGATLVEESGAGARRSVRVRDVLPVGTGRQRFLRLRVTRLRPHASTAAGGEVNGGGV